MLIIYFFWFTKNSRGDFIQKCKNELLILFFYTPIAFGNPTSLASSVLKNIFLTYSKSL